MKTIKLFDYHIRTEVDPRSVNLCDVVTTKKNNSYRKGTVQNITLRGVNVVGFGVPGVEFVKWCDVLSVEKAKRGE